jgi:hypothetical protein
VVIFREAFSSFDPSIHGWHHTRKKTLAKINNPPPPLRMCYCLGKACPARGGGGGGGTPKFLLSISAANPTYIPHTMPEDIQECMCAFLVQHGSALAILADAKQNIHASSNPRW